MASPSIATARSQCSHPYNIGRGTRGGVVIRHVFPADGEYKLSGRLVRGVEEGYSGVEGHETPHIFVITIDGEDVSKMSQAQLTGYRRRKVGVVFQFYNLIPTLTALENVTLPGLLAGDAEGVLRARAEELLGKLGVLERASHRPDALSGGEQQRVAIARALAKNPRLLLCDEPTGALDYETGKLVLEVIAKINHELGTTAMVITHNAAIAGMADRVLKLGNGRIVGETRPARKLTPTEISW